VRHKRRSCTWRRKTHTGPNSSDHTGTCTPYINTSGTNQLCNFGALWFRFDDRRNKYIFLRDTLMAVALVRFRALALPTSTLACLIHNFVYFRPLNCSDTCGSQSHTESDSQ
jgi:hypothetical protein